MKNWKKIALIVGGVVVLLAIVGFSVQQSRKGVVPVQTGKVVKEDLTAVVTASGEIKPKVYVNIGANAFGKITHLYVKEGDRVKKGQMLATIENVQPEADVNATKAAVNSAQTDFVAAQAAVNTGVAELHQAEAEYERAQLDYNRNKSLYDQQLIAKSDYDTKKAAYDTAAAQLNQAKAKLAQARAQQDSANMRIKQNAANLTRVTDVLSKTEYSAPFDGVITNLPVREGETVVIGIQNAPGSTLMTIADTSVITAEVKVDETDIVNVKLGQPAEVTIDAIPKQQLQGRGDGDRQQRRHPLHRRLDRAIDFEQPGSQGFQSGGDARESAGEPAARPFDHGAHHHRDPQRRVGHSDSGTYGSPARRPGDR